MLSAGRQWWRCEDIVIYVCQIASKVGLGFVFGRQHGNT